MNDRLDTVVLGAGVSGLALAERLLALDPGRRLLVVEKEPRPGGLIRTSVEDDGSRQEWGPETIVDDGSLQGALADLGLADRLLPAAPQAKRRWLAHRGRLVALPAGPGAFLRSPLLSPAAKLRIFCEPFVPRGRDPEESFADFVARRFGRAVLERLAEPFAVGIYACVPERMEMASCFPKLLAAERKHGSVLRGARREGLKPGRIGSFPGGLQELTETLAERLGARLATGESAVALERRPEGGYTVVLAGPGGWRRLTAAEVVVAVPARDAAPLLAPLDEALGRELAAIEWVTVVSVHHLVPAAALPAGLRGFGYLIPRAEARDRVLGVLFSSCLFPGRAPDGTLLVRTLLGGARNPGAYDEEPARYADEALASLRRLTGLQGRPIAARVRVRRHCLPVYAPGHQARLARIDARLAGLPGLHLTGLSYRGSSVARCLENARALAARLAAARPAAVSGA